MLALRRRLARVARSVADTEVRLAASLDSIAERSPERADSLHEQAANARRMSEHECVEARQYENELR